MRTVPGQNKGGAWVAVLLAALALFIQPSDGQVGAFDLHVTANGGEDQGDIQRGASVFTAELRDYYVDDSGFRVAWDGSLPTCGTVPDGVTCSYNHTFIKALGGSDLTKKGITRDNQYGFGIWDRTPYGLSTINYVTMTYIGYIPGRGKKPEEICRLEANLFPCGSFKPGEVNPHGLRGVDMKTGRQLAGPPDFKYLPMTLEYDLLSYSLLSVVAYWPQTAGPRGHETEDGRPILAFGGINETTGVMFSDPRHGRQTVSFCKECPDAPQGITLPYDYDSMAFSASTVDSYDQTFYCVLYDSSVGVSSQTLFGIRRPTNLTDPLYTIPDQGIWNISIDWGSFQMYQWPPELLAVSKLEFNPKDVAKILGQELLYQVIQTDQKALYAVATIKEKVGPCATRRCGAKLTTQMWEEEQAFKTETYAGDRPYNPFQVPTCLCPSAVIRININAQAVERNTVLGNAALDPTGAPYTILQYLDSSYPAHLQGEGRANYWLENPPLVPTYPDIQKGVSTWRARLPETDVDQITYDEVPLAMYFVDNKPAPFAPKGANYDGNKYFNNFDVGGDSGEFQVVGSQKTDHFPLFLSHSGRDSKMTEELLAYIYTLETIAAKSYLNARGVTKGRYVCETKPFSCKECQDLYRNDLEKFFGQTVTSAEMFTVWSSLYAAGQYPIELFKSTSLDVAAEGATQEFVCPEACDEYSCEECWTRFQRHCAVYAQAGDPASFFNIIAINVFGRQQRTNSDNFTVTILGSGFAEKNVAGMPTDDIQLGPLWRNNSDGYVGGLIATGAPSDSDPVDQAWTFPNYQNLGARPGVLKPVGFDDSKGPGGTPSDLGTTFPAECGTPGKCVRYMTRPRALVSRGAYRVNFAIDKAGNYTLIVTNRAKLEVDEEQHLDFGNLLSPLGTKGQPYLLTVLPGPTAALYSTADGPGLLNGKVGFVSTFEITARDVYGNERSVGGDKIDIVMKGPEYVSCSLPEPKPLPADYTTHLTEPVGLVAYCNITDLGTSVHRDYGGKYLVNYYITTRTRANPVYETDVRIKKNGVFNGIVTTQIEQGLTDAVRSFAIETQPAHQGLTGGNGGYVAEFTIQAIDKFGNLQENGGDPFNMTVTDANGAMGIAWARDLVSTPAPTSAPTDAPVAFTGRRLLQTSISVPGSDPNFLPPKAEVVFDKLGQYRATYTVYKAGPVKVELSLFGTPPGPKPGDATGAPFVITMRAAESSPSNCLVQGSALDGFVAGFKGAGGYGPAVIITMRDAYGNLRTEIEDVYLETHPFTGEFHNFPTASFKYNLECFEGLSSDRCAKVVDRTSEGVKILEVPITAEGNTKYNRRNKEVTLATRTVYLEGGQFRIEFTSTLAGYYDLALTMAPVDIRGVVTGDAEALMGANGFKGEASIRPYLSPWPIVVAPAEFSVEKSELFQWLPSQAVLKERGLERVSTDRFYSTLQGRTHEFVTSDGNLALPLKNLFGTAGITSTFGIQRRDKYGNVMKDRGRPFQVVITGTDDIGQAVPITARGLPGPLIEYEGSGQWYVSYESNGTGSVALDIGIDDAKIKKQEVDPETGELVTVPWTVEVAAAGTDARYSFARGPGLRGTINGKRTTITVVARDKLGNQKTDIGEAQMLESRRFWLYLDLCTGPSDAECLGLNLWSGSAAQDLLQVGEIEDFIPGEAPGTYVVGYTPFILRPPAFIKIIILYDSVEGTRDLVAGITDIPAERPPGAFLATVPYQLRLDGVQTTPEQVFARVRTDVEPAFPGTSKIDQSKSTGQVAYRGGVAGRAQTLLLSVRDLDGLDLTTPESLGQVEAQLFPALLRPDGSPQLGGPAAANFMTFAPEARYTVSLRDTPQYVIDNGNGTYTIMFPEQTVTDGNVPIDGQPSVIQAGKYKMTIRISPISAPDALGEIYGSPNYNVTIRPAKTSAGSSLVFDAAGGGARVGNRANPQTVALSYTAGTLLNMTVHSYDRFGNMQVWDPFTGADPITSVLTRPVGGQGSVVSGALQDLQDSRYFLTYVQNTRGQYELRLFLNGVAFSGSDGSTPPLPGISFPESPTTGIIGDYIVPLTITPAELHAPNCYARSAAGTSLASVTPAVGTWSELQVYEADVYGNDRDEVTVNQGNFSYFEIVFQPLTPGKPSYSIPMGSEEPNDLYFTGTAGGSIGYLLQDGALNPHKPSYIAGGTGPPFIAGPYNVEIYGSPLGQFAGVHILGSPYQIQLLPGDISLENSIAYGEGVQYDNGDGSGARRLLQDGASTGGTVRAGVIANLVIQARDKYENDLTAGDEDFQVVLKPVLLGKTSVGCGVDVPGITECGLFVPRSSTGKYIAQYVGLSAGEMLLQVQLQGLLLPTSQYLLYNPNNLEPVPRPDEMPPKSPRGQFAYPGSNKIKDTTFVVDETGALVEKGLEPGVVVDILPGPQSAFFTYAEDVQDTISAMLGGGRVGEASVGAALEFQVVAVDVFGNLKVDTDPTQKIQAELTYTSDSVGNTVDISPRNYNSAETERLSERWQRTVDGRWYHPVYLVNDPPGTAYYRPDPTSVPVPVQPGGYSLEVLLLTLDESGAEIKREPIGEGDVKSPYDFIAKSAASSGGQSGLDQGEVALEAPPDPTEGFDGLSDDQDLVDVDAATPTAAPTPAPTISVAANGPQCSTTATNDNSVRQCIEHPQRLNTVQGGGLTPEEATAVGTAIIGLGDNQIALGAMRQIEQLLEEDPGKSYVWQNYGVVADALLAVTQAPGFSSGSLINLALDLADPNSNYYSQGAGRKLLQALTGSDASIGDAGVSRWDDDTIDLLTGLVGADHDGSKRALLATRFQAERALQGARGTVPRRRAMRMRTEEVVRRRRLQQRGYDVVVEAGVQKEMTIQLRDDLGNPQEFNIKRRIDVIEVYLGETLQPGTPSCGWLPDSEAVGGMVLPDPTNNVSCSAVFVGWQGPGGPGPAYGVGSAGLKIGEERVEGLSRATRNDYLQGAFSVNFTIDFQLPALVDNFYNLDIILNGQPLGSSPYKLWVQPGPAYGPSSVMVPPPDGVALRNPRVNEPYNFTIQARDKYGNNKTTSDESSIFVVDLSVVKRSFAGTASIVRGCTANSLRASDCSFIIDVTGDPEGMRTEGHYVISFTTETSSDFSKTPDNEGDYRLSVRVCPDVVFCSEVNNLYNPLGRDDFSGAYAPSLLHVVPGVTNGPKSVAFGADLFEGGLVGTRAWFYIEARDQYGNRVLQGGDKFEVLIYQPQNKGRAKLVNDIPVDQGNGLYLCEFDPEWDGQHSIIVLFKGVSIFGSPFDPAFRSIDGAIDPASTRAINENGIALSQGIPPVTAGDDFEVLVQAYTLPQSFVAFPRAKKLGGDKVVAYLSGGELNEAPVEVVAWESIGATDNAAHVAGRYSLVFPGQTLNRALTYKLFVNACEGSEGTRSQPMGGRECAPGKDLVGIKGSPYNLIVRPAATSANNSYAIELTEPEKFVNGGDGWEAGTVSTFSIQARDKYNNNLRYSPDDTVDSRVVFDVEVTGVDDGLPLKKAAVTRVEDLKDGQLTVLHLNEGVYMVAFVSNRAQYYRFDMSLLGEPLSNSGAEVYLFPGPVDVPNCIIEDYITPALAGEGRVFYIISRDRFGNRLTNGDLDFKARIDMKDVLTDPGSGDNPLYAQDKAQQTFVDVENNDGSFTRIQDFKHDGVYTFTDGSSIKVRIFVRDEKDGTYKVTYFSERSGPGEIQVYARFRVVQADGTVLDTTGNVCESNDAKALCSKYATLTAVGYISVNFDAGPPDPRHTIASSDVRALESTLAGERTTFVITARDSYRNPQTSDGYTFNVALEHMDAWPPVRVGGEVRWVDEDVVDGGGTVFLAKGLYVGEFMTTLMGNYTLIVRRFKKHIKGLREQGLSYSPFSPLAVIPGGANNVRTIVNHAAGIVALPGTGAARKMFTAVAGQVTNFTITTADAFDNPLSTGGDQFVIQVGLLIEGILYDNLDGSYIGSYLVTAASSYNLRVTINRKPIQGSNVIGVNYDPVTQSFPLQVVADKTGVGSIAFGGGLATGVAGSESIFVVQARDQYGNDQYVGGDGFVVNITGRGDQWSFTPEDMEDGTYLFEYTLFKSGFYDLVLYVQLDEEQGGGWEPFFDTSTGNRMEMLPAPTSFRTSQADGEGLTYPCTTCSVFTAHSFFINPADVYLNSITEGNTNAFEVYIATGSGTIFDFARVDWEPEVAPEVVGTDYDKPGNDLDMFVSRVLYRVDYTVATAGRYEVSIKYLGRHLLGSPYELIITTGLTGVNAPVGHPNRCQYDAVTSECSYVVGNTLTQAIISTGNTKDRLSGFRIIARDRFGNDKFTGGDDFRVMVTRPDTLRTSSRLGWNMDVPNSNPSRIDLNFGHVICVDNNDGSYDCETKFIKTGEHRMDVSFHSAIDGAYGVDQLIGSPVGTAAPYFPYVLNVDPRAALWPPDPEASYAYGVGTLGGIAGEVVTFQVQGAKNRLIERGSEVVGPRGQGPPWLCGTGDPDAGWVHQYVEVGIGYDSALVGDIVRTDHRDAFNTSIPITLLDSDNGTFAVSYRPTIAGTYIMNVTMEGLLLAPFDVEETQLITIFPGPTDPASCTTEGVPGLPFVSAGRRNTFTITARDVYGNQQVPKNFQLTPDHFEVDIAMVPEGLSDTEQALLDSTLIVTDSGNGDFVVAYIARKQGSYKINVYFGKDKSVDPPAPVHIAGSPFSQEVAAGEINAQYTTLEGLAGEELEDIITGIQAKAQARLRIVARDDFRNELRTGGDRTRIYVEIVRTDSNTKSLAAIEDNGDGTYDAVFEPRLTGDYTITLFIDDIPVLPDPTNDYTGAGAISSVAIFPANTLAIGSGSVAAEAGKPASFYVQARDRDDQNKARGGDNITVRLVPLQATNEYGIPLEKRDFLAMDQEAMIFNDERIPGRYTVEYSVMEFGDYHLEIQVCGVPIVNRCQHIKGSPYPLTINKQLPPVQGYAQMSNTATRLNIKFEDALGGIASTNRARLFGLDDCGKVFDAETMRLLGDGPLCTFVSQREMVVYLGYAATVAPNDALVYKAGAILSAEENSDYVQGSSVVRRPANAPKPTVVTSAPVKLSVCDDFTLDASGSYGTAGRQLFFTFTMIPNVPNERELALLLYEFSQSRVVNKFTIDGELLAVDVPYTFLVTVENFLKELVTVEHTVVRKGFPVPRLQVQGDPIIRSFRNKPVYVRAEVAVPLGGDPRCAVPVPEMTFRWTPDYSKASRTFILDAKTKNRKDLYISPSSLRAGLTYFLKVIGEVEGAPELNNEATAVVEIKYSALAVRVEAPMTVSQEDDIVIDASTSYDPDDPNPDEPIEPFGPFQFQWYCQKLAADGLTTEGECFDDIYGLMQPDIFEAKFTLPGDILSPGVYRFTAVIVKEPLFSSTGFLSGRNVNVNKVVIVTPTEGAYDLKPLLRGEIRFPEVNFTKYAINPSKFEASFRNDLAENLAIDPSTITLGVAYEGSVVVPFNISTFEPNLAVYNQLKSVFDAGVNFATLQLTLRQVVEGVPENIEQIIEVNTVDPMLTVRPVVSITPLASDVVNSNERLAIEAGIQNATIWGNVTTLNWEVLEGVLDLDAYPEKLLSPRNSSNLVIKRDVLGAGQIYTLRLSATNTISGLSTANEITFTVNGAPSSGTFELQPSVGFAASDLFTLTCAGWEDDGAEPVTYEFRYFDPVTGDPVPLVSNSRINEQPVIFPPITDSFVGYDIVISAVIVDFYNAKTVVNRTITVYPPQYHDAFVTVEGDATEGLLAGSYNLTGASAFTHLLVERQLRIAKGTNNIAQLLILAKSVAKINLDAAEVRALRPRSRSPNGTESYALEQDIQAQEAVESAAADEQLSRVLSALQDAVNSVQFTKEELDAFGEVFRTATAGTDSLRAGDNKDKATSSVFDTIDASRGTGLESAAAQSLLDSAGGIVEAGAVEAGEESTGIARESLLSPPPPDAPAVSLVSPDSAKKQAEADAVMGMLSKLSNAGLNGAVDGEAPFAVSSKNLQVSALRTANPSGTFGNPPAPGQNASSAPSFDVPAGVAGDGSTDVDVASSVNNVNPFEGIGNGSATVQQNVQGNVASFDFKPKGSEGKLQVNTTGDPIQFKIPITLSASTCRKTVGGCRYWDEEALAWSTEGLYERTDLSTPEYIVCETNHLSSFGISAEDVVPSFNLANPIGDADLFTNINLDNALAIFVVAFILAAFAIANFFGYKKDVRDRHRKNLQDRIATIDGRLTTGAGARLPSRGAPVKPDKAAGGFNTDELADEGHPLKKEESVVGTALRTKHDVAGIMGVVPEDTFTRPQRLTVFLCIVLGHFAVSAVFFGLDPSNLAMKMVIGLLAAVFMIPSKQLFKVLFQKSTYRAPPKKPAARVRAFAKERALARKEKSKRGLMDVEADLAAEGMHPGIPTMMPGVGPVDPARLDAMTSPAAAASHASSHAPGGSAAASAAGAPSHAPGGSAAAGEAAPGSSTATSGAPLPPGSSGSGAGGKKRPSRRRFKNVVAPDGTPLAPGMVMGPNGQPIAAPPAPPGPPSGGKMRPRRRTGSRTPSTGLHTPYMTRDQFGVPVGTGSPPPPGYGSGAVTPGGGPAPPPPPPPGGGPVRPRRKGSKSARSGATSGVTTPMHPAQAYYAAMGFSGQGSPDGAKSPGSQRVSPTGAPLPEGGASSSRRPQRSRSRAALKAAMGAGDNRVSPTPGEPGAPPPPPPPPPAAGGAPRPRRGNKGGKGVAAVQAAMRMQMLVGGFSHAAPPVPGAAWGGQLPPQGPVDQTQAMLDAAARALAVHSKKRPGGRPTGRSKRSGVSQQMVRSMITGAPDPASGRGLSALRASQPIYVPEAIERVVVKIQKAWRRKMLIRQIRRRKATIVLQSYWRGFITRRRVKEERAARARGRTVQGLWWVSAHQHSADVADDGKGAAGGGATTGGGLGARLKGKTGEEAIRGWVGKSKAKVEDNKKAEEAKQAADEKRKLQRRQRRRLERRRRRRAARKGLPRWFIYVTYAFAFVFCAACSYFIMLYGLIFEPAIARAWLLSTGFAIFMEIFVQEPAKIVALTLILERIKNEVKQRKINKTKRREAAIAGVPATPGKGGAGGR